MRRTIISSVLATARPSVAAATIPSGWPPVRPACGAATAMRQNPLVATGWGSISLAEKLADDGDAQGTGNEVTELAG
jgi:hypothetical protein